MLRTRVITALGYAPLLLATAWLGNPAFPLLLSLFALLAYREFHRLAPSPPSLALGWGLSLAFLLSPFFPQALPPLLGFLLISSLGWALVRGRPPSSGLWTLWGVLYCGWLLSHLLALRLDMDRGWVIFALLVTFATDTGAFFIGRAWGRHHLAPALSPGKTWEGALGGLLSAILASLALSYLLGLPLPYPRAILLGGLMALLAQVGDLVESQLKRSAGVKDSGKLLPGHGGVLDRIDSLVFTAPLLYYYLIWLS